MRPPERVVLVGFMAAGKSSVGACLAELLGWSFVDLDRLIEAGASHSVAEIFRDAGEPAFRRLEQRAAEAAQGMVRCVVAAGGGAFADARTLATLQAGAVTVWLRCDLETVLARLPLDASRPLAGNRERIGQLMAEREPFYRRADLTVDATSGAVRDTTRRVWDALQGPLGLLKVAETR